jgi:hypothetical protein
MVPTPGRQPAWGRRPVGRGNGQVADGLVVHHRVRRRTETGNAERRQDAKLTDGRHRVAPYQHVSRAGDELADSLEIQRV